MQQAGPARDRDAGTGRRRLLLLALVSMAGALATAGAMIIPPAPPPAPFAFDESRAEIYFNGVRLHSPVTAAAVAPAPAPAYPLDPRARSCMAALPRLLPWPGYRVLVYVDGRLGYRSAYTVAAGGGAFHVYDGEVARAVSREIAGAVAVKAGRGAVAGNPAPSQLPRDVLRQIVARSR